MVSIDFTKKWEMSDVALKMRDSDHLLYANKYILANFSPVFKTMLFGDFAESKQDVVKLEGIDYGPMLEILKIFHQVDRRFDQVYPLYTVTQVVQLWQTADGYDIPLIREFCRQQFGRFNSTDALEAAILCGFYNEKTEILKKMSFQDIQRFLAKGGTDLVLSQVDAAIIVEKRMEAERGHQTRFYSCFNCHSRLAADSIGKYQCTVCGKSYKQ